MDKGVQIFYEEPYEIPCVGAWDGFHVCVSNNLKNNFSFKNKYTVTNMELIGNNKRFFHLTAGAPGRLFNMTVDVISGKKPLESYSKQKYSFPSKSFNVVSTMLLG